MQITALTRVFKYEGQELADPGANFTPAQVLDFYSGNFPELVSAEVEGPNELDGKMVYTFKRSTGVKGLDAAQEKVAVPFVERLALVAEGRADPLEPRHIVVLDTALANKHSVFGTAMRGSFRAKASLQGLPPEAMPLLL